MTIFALVEHGDSLLCIEIDDSQPILLKPGKVVQTFGLNPTVEISSPGTALVVVPPARNGRRKFRLKSLQQFQVKPNGSLLYGEKAAQFREWLIKRNIKGTVRAIATFKEFFAETQKGKYWTEVAYGAFHFGWKRGWWEVNDVEGSECCLELA